jgi:hypothetical protein
MKTIHVFIYHSFYWIYRIVNILAFNYFLFQQSWYKGAYVVQLVLIPFFYSNYGLLIPVLIKRNYKKFVAWSIVWLVIFIWVYSNWTIYQRHILYGEELWEPNYIETLNNVIYIWLISTCFCLFEYWINNLNKNQELALNRKNHLLKSEENKMLNHLLSEYLNTLDKKVPDELPDKILLLSDFFKYVLYNTDKPVTLRTELSYIRIFEELKNSNVQCVKIKFGSIKENLMISSSQIISIINRLVTILYKDKTLEISIETENNDQIVISTLIYISTDKKEILTQEFSNSKFAIESSSLKFIVFLDKQLVSQPISGADILK